MILKYQHFYSSLIAFFSRLNIFNEKKWNGLHFQKDNIWKSHII